MKRFRVYCVPGTALLAALAVAACARDRSGPAAATEPAARVADGVGEGALVRATVRDAIAPGGSAAEVEAGVFPAAAAVSGGRAMDPASGTFLAGTDGNGVDGEREFGFRADDGHRHRLVLRGLAGHGPIASARYEEDGEVVAEVAWRWEGRSGGWVLRERALTLYRHGRVVLRQMRQAQAVDVTASGEGPGAGLAPPVQRMQAVAFACGQEWANYIGASATLLIAGEAAALLPNPVTIGAVLTAGAAWERAFNTLVNCELRAAGAF